MVAVMVPEDEEAGRKHRKARQGQGARYAARQVDTFEMFKKKWKDDNPTLRKTRC